MVEHLSSVHRNLGLIPGSVERKRKFNNGIFLALRYRESLA